MNYLVSLHMQDRKNNENQTTDTNASCRAPGVIKAPGTDLRPLPITDGHLYQR